MNSKLKPNALPTVWIKAISLATPGMEFERRMAVSKMLYFEDVIQVVQPNGETAHIQNPHKYGCALGGIADTVRSIVLPQVPAPSTTAWLAAQENEPIGFVPVNDDYGPDKNLNDAAIVKPTAQNHDIARRHELAVHKQQLICQLAEVSAQIAQIDLNVAQRNRDAYARKGASNG